MDNNPNPPKLRNYGTEVGRSGTYIFSGIITLEEYNADLIGQNARKIYDIMRRSDATVRAALQAVKLPLLALDYTIEPASDDAADIEIADHITDELFNQDVNFQQFAREAFTMFDFGFSVFEKVFLIREFRGRSLIGLSKLGSRKQRSILYWQTKDGRPGIQQQLLGTGGNSKSGLFDIDAEKLIIFTNEKEGDNYEGISLLRYAYKDWDMKDKLGLINAIALEKQAMGIPVIKPPKDAPPDQVTKAEEIVSNIRTNENAYLRVPVGWEAEMLDMKANTTKEVLPTIEYHNHQIMLSVLAQFLMLGSGKSASGSRATSQDHSALFMLALEAAAKNFVHTVQTQLINQWCDLNYSNLPNGYPKLKSSRVSDDDVTVLAEAFASLTTAGLITPDAELEQYLRKQLHAPDVPDEVRENYDLKMQSSKVVTQGLIDNGGVTPAAPTDNAGKPQNNTDKTQNADSSIKQASTKASVIKEAQTARRRLIEALEAE